jgi:branched-chain amino acid transport system ATP-binding protein
MSAENTLLEVKDVSIEFGGLRAVDNFSCSLGRGELVGLIGPNGAGKTTVFNMLSGIYKPTSGSVTFTSRSGRTHEIANGRHKLSPARLNRLGISRTFQNIRLFSALAVEDNVLIALHGHRSQNAFEALFRLKGFREDEKAMRERAAELLELFGIAGKKHELAGNLPYGEQRKLEICRALASHPSLLLLDEPAAGMNPQETAELMNMITLIRDRFHLTILLIEHDMRLVMGICERIMVLNYGATIAEGAPREIQQNPLVIKAYLGSEASSV